MPAMMASAAPASALPIASSDADPSSPLAAQADPVLALCTAASPDGDVRTYWFTVSRCFAALLSSAARSPGDHDRAVFRSSVPSQLAAVDGFARSLVIRGTAPKNLAPVRVVVSTRRSPGIADMLHWPGFILDSVLFVKLPALHSWCPEAMNFQDSILALLELAENCLECSRIVVCLDKSLRSLPSVIRTFRIMGFELVHPQIYSFGDDYVLCGYEI
ncbi:Ornithine decarboxylase antizyme 2 [Polyrhizophydium stewartii]|uniref:Ornithine decarboxylase antizyme n=1 Tax=Polyrhizophydium stewartii TaxID=2732419 RepID=A0ABR4NEL8_9FUNG